MIIGIGVDTVEIVRFTRQLERSPRLIERLFTEAEWEFPAASLAARFAAKEALIKALGGSDGIEWQMMEVLRAPNSTPTFTRTSGLESVLAVRGARWPHLSMTHDGGVATAFVIVETEEVQE